MSQQVRICSQTALLCLSLCFSHYIRRHGNGTPSANRFGTVSILPSASPPSLSSTGRDRDREREGGVASPHHRQRLRSDSPLRPVGGFSPARSGGPGSGIGIGADFAVDPRTGLTTETTAAISEAEARIARLTQVRTTKHISTITEAL